MELGPDPGFMAARSRTSYFLNTHDFSKLPDTVGMPVSSPGYCRDQGDAAPCKLQALSRRSVLGPWLPRPGPGQPVRFCAQTLIPHTPGECLQETPMESR